MTGSMVGRLGLTLTSGALLVAAHSATALWPLGAVGLVPWLAATRRSSVLGAGGLGALLGTMFGCGVVPWVPEALRALGSSWIPSIGGLLATASWAKAPLFAATGVVARGLIRAAPSVQVAGIVTVFGAGEWWLSRWAGGVPAAFVGHSQLPATGVAQLAVAGGVPLISAWLVAINAAIALSLSGHAPARPLTSGLAAGWLVLAVAGLPLAERLRAGIPEDRRATLLVVQPDLPRYARWDAAAQPWILERVSAFTAEALARHGEPVDAILWPENLLTAPLEARPVLSASLQRHVDTWGTPLVTGLVRAGSDPSSGRYRSSVVWIEPGRGVVASLDKARGVPLLEASWSLPGASLLAPLFGRAARWPKVEEAPGPGGPLVADRGFSVAPALCYEVLFPGLVAARRDAESFAILNLADDSWVKGPEATRQLTDWAAFRAIEQRLPLIRVAHGGLSTHIDAFGRQVASLPRDRFASTAIAVGFSPPPTFLERIVIFGVPTGLGIIVGWLHRRLGGRAQGVPALRPRQHA